MKRMLSLFLVFFLILAGCGEAPAQTTPAVSTATAPAAPEGALFSQPEPVLVAEPLEGGARQRVAGEFMALESYGTGLEVEKENRSGDSLVRSFDGGEESFAALQAYVELLCSEYEFELAAEPYTRTVKSTFFDFCLNYTGPGAPAAHTQTGTFSGTPCDLAIYGTIERGDLEGAIWYDTSLTGLDGGYRFGQEAVDTAPVGQSALAGLWRNGDGSFSTTDGRFAAAPGRAMLLWDGESTEVSARFLLDADQERQEVILEDENAALVRFYLPLSCELSTGRTFGQEQFIVESGYAVDAGGLFDTQPNYTWPSMFAVRREEGWLVPVLGMGGGMNRLDLRVMYADGETAVFYACAAFDTSPKTLELLAAVALTGEGTRPTPTPQQSGGGAGNCSACGGSGRCTSCDGTGRVSNPLAGTGEWVEQTCLSCRPAGSGNCPFCGGSGRA